MKTSQSSKVSLLITAMIFFFIQFACNPRVPSPTISATPTEATSTIEALLQPTPVLSCFDPVPAVAISVTPPTLPVGSTLTIIPSPNGVFALTQYVDLIADGAAIARLNWQTGEVTGSGDATLQILPNEGKGRFILQAIQAGTTSLKVWAYGDTGFCTTNESGQCICGTTHRGAYSDQVGVTITTP